MIEFYSFLCMPNELVSLCTTRVASFEVKFMLKNEQTKLRSIRHNLNCPVPLPVNQVYLVS